MALDRVAVTQAGVFTTRELNGSGGTSSLDVSPCSVQFFYSLEDYGLLDPTSGGDLLSLHFAFLPLMQKQLDLFCQTYSHHNHQEYIEFFHFQWKNKAYQFKCQTFSLSFSVWLCESSLRLQDQRWLPCGR